MAEAVGIDKDKPKEAITVAVKMLKGECMDGRAGRARHDERELCNDLGAESTYLTWRLRGFSG